MGATKEDIEASYDVGNEFFRLWLDERMCYTCALFESEVETLEQAQLNKLAYHAAAARVRPGARALDLRCGWGPMLRHFVDEAGAAEAHGITLSTAQLEEIRLHPRPGLTAELVSYRDFQPAQPF